MNKNYGVDVDRWKSNGKIERLDYDEEVEKNNGKHIGKNCGSDVGPK